MIVNILLLGRNSKWRMDCGEDRGPGGSPERNEYGKTVIFDLWLLDQSQVFMPRAYAIRAAFAESSDSILCKKAIIGN